MLRVNLLVNGFHLLTQFLVYQRSVYVPQQQNKGWLLCVLSTTGQCCHDEVNFLQNPYKRHPIALPLGYRMFFVGSTSVKASVMYKVSSYIGPTVCSYWQAACDIIAPWFRRTGVGVTKLIFSVPLFSLFSRITKTLVAHIILLKLCLLILLLGIFLIL